VLLLFVIGSSADSSVTFIVVGDWGRQGLYNQSEVAALMGKVATVREPQFVVSTGDNFYQYGLAGEDDILFTEAFTNVYNAESLAGVPWYAVLGNHGELRRVHFPPLFF
jgi:tartrate-resistant acid phosphatase type 5